MFIVCYFFVAFAIVLVVGSYLNLDVCMVGVPLIPATLLVKMCTHYSFIPCSLYPPRFVYLSYGQILTPYAIPSDFLVSHEQCRDKHTIKWMT